MTYDPINYASISLVVMIEIVVLVLFYRVRKLPSLLYGNCLRSAGLLVIINAIIDACWEYILEMQGPVGTSMSNVLRGIETICFIVAQLEFLKILTPFFGYVTPKAVTYVQIGVVAVSQIYLITAFYPFFPGAFYSLRWVQIIWPSALGIYDLMQQTFLVYFVLYRLRDTTATFRIQFVLLAVSCFVILSGGAIITMTVTGHSRPGISLLGDLSLHIYGECSFISMELLRAVIQNPATRRNQNANFTDSMATASNGVLESAEKKKVSAKKKSLPKNQLKHTPAFKEKSTKSKTLGSMDEINLDKS
ncbi:hypothetical protein BATDEDRAFT_91985 [Batrachochytrium dendrobatidis JAM81]|uniref:Uncharacterized protein n=2 Tax=Batrachochytrium dendrobatidis TaxID=109871 RepID=F4PC23_BATDJ|nr:uncharacterized protein BATDEDRAFT_91985 [Batrachochytrium dendrobatidis JAM81]EGF77234.1 hypothetical protein BATDEDRAFT_91985 [Batrachochytrium dendrobatidis JAM81]KAK5665491.1 hypothetical protein QVD99_007838 [Batrachochytrium dendrobatidis]OAJ44709.1 hypothetical protein BDEG_27911 [Batrachochytrium dendrobatidis JEL423]|eukprot:XP_006682322.1 hypothetical protein BATDEDRAFT_91985 [Batrachochytrium dendrobatidis JAM81]